MPKKLKFRDIKKVGEIQVSIKMGGLEKISMKIAEKMQATKNIFIKLQNKQNIIELSESIKNSNKWFEGFSQKIDQEIRKKNREFNEGILDIVNKLSKNNKLDSKESKLIGEEINGDITVDDVSTFLSTLWENHEMAQTKFIETGEEEYGEMALDIKVAINNIEEIKTYLIEHGKYDKVEYDYSFE
ncbi:MAG: hypothetical protein EAX96_17460 [Candidatus Lokiarchaeota archaeon]|nr:hypothetical protein [Candidatus Lokiarchaeota archaeon]